MFKKLFLLFALVFLSLAAACSNDEAAEIDGDEAAEEAKTGDIVVGFDQDLSTIDPHGTNDVNAIQIRRHLYQTLVARELDMSRKPGLSAEWEQTDKTTWNFKLTEGVTFHKGSEFTADDVKASLERVQDPSIKIGRAHV